MELWVRSGGRCALCNTYLLEGPLSGRPLSLGEAAHIVGQSTDARSPRGGHALSPVLRGNVDNLILLCPRDHAEIDAQGALDVFTVERLRRVKQDHEDRIRHVTGLGQDRTTTVVRVLGSVHGQAVELSQDAAALAVTAVGRFPRFLNSYARHGIEVDLQRILGEFCDPSQDAQSAAASSRSYYEYAVRAIGDVLRHQLREGIERGVVQHVSVFGFARLPLLVYLGSVLDDTVPTDVYQRHRPEQSWTWPAETGSATAFTVCVDQDVPADDEAVVVMNVSGTIARHEVPAALTALRRYEISPVGRSTHPDILRQQASLQSLETTMRGFLASLETEAKTLRRLHVLPALPMSAAVALGRTHHPQVHPELVIYERLAGRYVATLEVGRAAP
ncbi:SAVED domain-containing protein [Kitasatospora sp. NPDC094016]|uniref:SAVED domain-containing protein n=1 Tax=Kitasatospora sp. NPDC094016 TaxID=3154986 RepID=UPI0033185CE2